MGNAFGGQTVPILITLEDVHHVRARNSYYYASVNTGGSAARLIGRTQTLGVEVSLDTVLNMTVYECPDPIFNAELARCVGVLRVPFTRLAEQYSTGLYQQWFNLDTLTDPRGMIGDRVSVAQKFEKSFHEASQDVYAPKLCLSVFASNFEPTQRKTCAIFVGEQVKTSAGPDLKALMASHKQQAEYIEALHEELRRLQAPAYRPIATVTQSAPITTSVAAPTVMTRTIQMPAATSIVQQPVNTYTSGISPPRATAVITQSPQGVMSVNPVGSVMMTQSPSRYLVSGQVPASGVVNFTAAPVSGITN